MLRLILCEGEVLFATKFLCLYRSICSTQNQKSQTPNPSTSRGDVLQMDPMTVMVLNSTHPFEYESSEHGRKTMFHAKVATAKQYYHVKVFNVSLREKFTKNNFIIISNFVKGREILEINENSFVVEAGPDLKFEVPNSIIKRANETPKIRHIEKGASGALFYGLFTLIKVMPENLFLIFLNQHLEPNRIILQSLLNDSIVTQESTFALVEGEIIPHIRE
nr:interferon-activable protein 205-B-like [Meriones unguiculatus]